MLHRLARYRRSIAYGLLAAVTVAAPAFVAAAYVRAEVAAEVTRSDADERRRSADLTALLVDEAVANVGGDLTLLATRQLAREALAESDLQALRRHLSDLRAANPRITSAAALDPGGTVLARDPEEDLVGRNFAGREDIRGALAGPSWHASDVYASAAAAHLPVVAVALAVRDVSGVIGIFQVATPTSRVLELILPVGQIEGREILITDASSAVIASTRGRPPLSRSPVPPGGSGRALVEGQERLVTVATAKVARWTVTVLDDPEVVLAAQRRLEAVIAIALGIVLLTALGLGVALAAITEARRTASERVADALRAQRVANEELRLIDRAKSDFISVVSHEFRTPLTGIMGFSDLLREGPLSETDVREYAEDIHTDAERLTRLVNDMLDLDRMAAGRMTITPVPLDVNAIIREVAARAAPTAPVHAIALDLDPAIPPVAADHDRIVQVMTNLVSNAVKYSPQGGRVTIGSGQRNGSAHLWVADTGIGMPPEALGSVFDRFSRVESAATRDIRGTGLGLAIVKEIVEMHGGKVWVESELGRGSVFHLSLPLAKLSRGPAPPRTS